MRAVYGVGPARIIVTMPPRHGKSETTSKWAPAWFLDHFPDARVVVGSYESSFAAEWGNKVRNLVEEFRYELHVQRPRPLGGAADNWGTTDKGVMYTAGVNGGFTGKGAHLFLVDDPVKNSQQASSITFREMTWNWFTSTAYTRLEPGGVVLVVMTRWHHDDLAGRLISQYESQLKELEKIKLDNAKITLAGGAESDLTPLPEIEPWHVLKLKAIAEADDPLGRAPGEALWPRRFPAKELNKTKSVVGSKVWRSLYQQEPTPDEGEIFNRSWFRYFEPHFDAQGELLGVFLYRINQVDPEKPEQVTPTSAGKPTFFSAEQLRIYQTIDPATSESNMADFFVIMTFMVTPKKDVLVWEVERERIPGPRQPEKLWASLRRNKAVMVGMETVAFQLSLFQNMRDQGYPCVRLTTDGDKVARATPAAVHMYNEKVFFRAQSQYLEALEPEVLQFPHGLKDDQVDALAYGVNAVLFNDVFAQFIKNFTARDEILERPSPFAEDSNGRPGRGQLQSHQPAYLYDPASEGYDDED